MLLSIIVPTYNVEDYLANCLESLVNQGLPEEDYEIIIVNDGATDSSGMIAASYEARYKQIRVHLQENQGLSAARNKGMELARGEFIYFIDSDDYIAYNTLPYALNLMKRHNLEFLGLEFKHTKSLDDWNSANPEVMETDTIEVMDGISYIAENKYMNNVWWYLVRRDYLMQTGLTFPVNRFVEDAIFTAMLIASTDRMGVSPLDFYRYVQRPNSIMTAKSKAHNMKMIHDYEKNVFDFDTQIQKLSKISHPKIEQAVKRLSARQHSFVFFMLAKCIKYRLNRKEVEPTLQRLSTINAYPISESFNMDYYNNKAYRVMRNIMNQKSLFFISLNTLSFTYKIFPNIYKTMDNLAFKLSGVRGHNQ